jgi:hypothetical protein
MTVAYTNEKRPGDERMFFLEMESMKVVEVICVERRGDWVICHDLDMPRELTYPIYHALLGLDEHSAILVRSQDLRNKLFELHKLKKETQLEIIAVEKLMVPHLIPERRT